MKPLILQLVQALLASLNSYLRSSASLKMVYKFIISILKSLSYSCNLLRVMRSNQIAGVTSDFKMDIIVTRMISDQIALHY